MRFAVPLGAVLGGAGLVRPTFAAVPVYKQARHTPSLLSVSSLLASQLRRSFPRIGVGPNRTGGSFLLCRWPHALPTATYTAMTAAPTGLRARVSVRAFTSLQLGLGQRTENDVCRKEDGKHHGVAHVVRTPRR